MNNINELKRLSRELKPSVRIGKKGLSDNLIEEVKKAFKKNRIVKIKLLKSFPVNSKEALNELVRIISQKTGSRVIQVIGNSFSLYKEKDFR